MLELSRLAVCGMLWTADKLNLNRIVCTQPLYNLVNRDVEVELLPLCRRTASASSPTARSHEES